MWLHDRGGSQRWMNDTELGFGMRLLLETVYEALEKAGQTIQGLQGSNTAVYTGLMTGDYEQVMSRDLDSIGTYHAVGTSRALLSNRISYFFDWHGPSMTIDTACSSSLYAVHHAVQQLRSGASKVAVAAGSNLLFDPLHYITESNFRMLSPSGRSRMWDAAADGYGRGEGVAAVILKPLSLAEADGDPIECIIRETAVNQDGKTKGLTMPSAKAQVSLIRDCYYRAGLDIDSPSGRPQYFEAHGTGTPAGDPVEAEAIDSAFFGSNTTTDSRPLLVGSIKTVVGHTEGTAGLAGILKASLALQHATIPPNLLFNHLNPQIEPFYHHLQVPTSVTPWPSLAPSAPRSASINSFGFGGANAHVILESYSPPSRQLVLDKALNILPFIFSAASEHSLSRYVRTFHEWILSTGNDVNLRSLATTLNTRRTRFPIAVSFTASSTTDLASQIENRIRLVDDDPSERLGTNLRETSGSGHQRILAVFTGQGAQWARMGADIILGVPSCRARFKELDAYLSHLPAEDRPSWSLVEELKKGKDLSQIGTAAISQPLCAAVQIVLTDLLRSARVPITAAVGHSSGEIAAAYAAGVVTAKDAICIAYYRGLYARLAQGSIGQPGAMIAVSSTFEDIQELLEEPEFERRACIAAINSPASVTIAGDKDAIEELDLLFKDEKKFSRLLKLDKAYHSHHMSPCATQYLQALERMKISVHQLGTEHCKWFSSVYQHDIASLGDSMSGRYWVDNMTKPVLFMDAVERAWKEGGPFDIAIEVGPHPALKTPTLNTIQSAFGCDIPYTGLLQREHNDVETFAGALGFIATQLGQDSVDLPAYEQSTMGSTCQNVITDLPPYSWNHDDEYWHESRYAKAIRGRGDAVHEILGHLEPNSTDTNMHWRQLLNPTEVGWLKGHSLQNQIVFPAAGYVVAALEAFMMLPESGSISCLEVHDLQIHRALAFDSEDSSVETIFSLTDIRRTDARIMAHFTYSAAVDAGGNSLKTLAGGKINADLGGLTSDVLPSRTIQHSKMMEINSRDFYSALEKLEYQYSGVFSCLSGLRRRLGSATGFISNASESEYLVHPASLDGVFQSSILAASAPGDGELWSLHVPSQIRRIRVNPWLCTSIPKQRDLLAFDSFASSKGTSFVGDVDVFPLDFNNAVIQVEGLTSIPFSPVTAENDKALFSTTVWGPAVPDTISISSDDQPPTKQQNDLACLLDRVAYFYLRGLERTIPSDHVSRQQEPYVHLFKYANHVLSRARSGEWSIFNPDWDHDTSQTLADASQEFPGIIDLRLLHAIGQNLPDIVRGDVTAIEIGMKDKLLTQFYENGLGSKQYARYIGKIVEQIVFRSPRIHCLEIGAGTGGATKVILQQSGQAFSSYTFTDISSGFFDSARAEFEKHSNRMEYKVLDITTNPLIQGFDRQYDLIVASAVLHATPSLKQTLRNVRSLLRPGGYLVIVELQSDLPARLGTTFGAFPGWWLGVQEGRVLSPCVSVAKWDELLRETGFSGCDTRTPDLNSFLHPFSLFVSQALDEDISFLREPLSSQPDVLGSSTSFTRELKDLVLLGGNSARSFNLIHQLESTLQGSYRSVRSIPSLDHFERLDISASRSFLVLSELDEPIFRSLTEARWDYLKRLLDHAGTILWVSEGRRGANPHANMSIGLLRSVMHELPNLNIQFLDVEAPNQLTAKNLGESLVRFEALTLWRHTTSGSPHQHLIIERELVLTEGGQVLLPRLLVNQEMNDRYNSGRRAIHRERTHPDHIIDINFANEGYFIGEKYTSLAKMSPTSLTAPVLQVTHSSLAAMRIAGQAQMFVTIAKCQKTSNQYVQLSSELSSRVIPLVSVQLEHGIPIGDEASLLSLVTLHLLSNELLHGLEPDDQLFIYEAPPQLLQILRNEAQCRGVYVKCATTRGDLVDVTTIHPNTHERVLRNFGLDSMSLFVDFSLTDESTRLAVRLKTYLGSSSRHESWATLFGHTGKSQSPARTRRVHSLLQKATGSALNGLSDSSYTSQTHQVVRIGEVPGCDHMRAPLTVVDWTADDHVLSRLQPIDSRPMFSENKTYWLVGLTSSLGLSLCQWMVTRGARYIVMSSRTPKIEPSWIDEMAKLGAVIKIYSSDITKREEVERVYAEISSTLPPVAGIAQGAMILRDRNMSETSLDVVEQITKPKAEGSVHLHELFQEDTLDFFIFLSSISSVVGMPGQSLYGAANLFMTSLAEQRRRQGLAASVINIGPIIGAGYITENSHDTTFMLDTMAGMHMSERDFHQMFAEAVLAGRPHSSTPYEISAGLRHVQLDEKVQPGWAWNPVFTHLLLDGKDQVASTRDASSQVSLEKRLQEAKTQDHVCTLIRNAVLEKLVSLFKLDGPKADDFSFDSLRLDELGTDSLMAVEIRTWLIKTLQVNIPVLQILNGMSIGQLINAAIEGIPHGKIPGVQQTSEVASESDIFSPRSTLVEDETFTGSPNNTSINDELESSSGREHPDWKTGARTDSSEDMILLDLSCTQHMFWFTAKLFNDDTSLNHTATFRLTGSVRVRDLEKAVKAVGNQHESLKTCFFTTEGKPIQGIMQSSALHLEHRKAENLDAVEQTFGEVHGHVYDLENGETARVVLLSVSPTSHFLVVGTTTITMDGTSSQIFLNDLLQHYQGHGCESARPPQYRDHVYSQIHRSSSQHFEKEVIFWKTQYPDFPPQLPILGTSSNKSRPNLVGFSHQRLDLTINVETKSKIRAICRKYRVTPFHFYLACFRSLLLRYSDAEDVSIGIGDSNRVDDGMMSCIGLFLNVLPLRFRTTLSDKFEDVLQNCRSTTYAALENAGIPFQMILNNLDPPRSATTTPLFQCFIDYRTGQRQKLSWDQCDLEMLSFDISKTGYDLNLDIIDDPDGNCLIMWFVRSDLYQNSEATILLESFEKLVKAFATEPNVSLATPDIYEDHQVERALSFSQGPTRDSSWPDTIVRRFHDIALAHPNEPALRYNREILTYSDLLKLTQSIVAALNSSGVSPGARIAILQESTPCFIASILGCMWVGAAFIPLDASLSEARLAQIVEDCKPAIVLVDAQTQHQWLQLDKTETAVIDASTLKSDGGSTPICASGRRLAQFLYTSGSSGVPKGILISHENLQNQIEFAQEAYRLGSEVVLHQTSCGFDLSYAQIFTALCFGGSLYLVPRHLRGDALEITKIIANEGITYTCATPTEYASWLRYGDTSHLLGSSWRRALCGGELVMDSLVLQFKDLKKDDLLFFNIYGPTETSIVASAMEIEYTGLPAPDSNQAFPAGFPLPNYSIYVVDSHLRPVPPRVQGEIYIGGASVSAGYVNNPQLTSEAFVPNPFATGEFKAKGWTTMHRVGDIGRWNEDGTILIGGRVSGDTQVKIRGIRVDLREVENAILATSEGLISEAVVSLRQFPSESSESSQSLLAHVVFVASHPTEGRKELLRSLLSSLPLPKYMRPVIMVPLEKTPRTSSSKLDRKAINNLPLPEAVTWAIDEHQVDTLTETESRLRDIWIQVIPEAVGEQHRVHKDTDFFNVGGTSILLLALQAQIKKFSSTSLSVIKMLEFSTLGAMAGLIEDKSLAREAPINWDDDTALSPAMKKVSEKLGVPPENGMIIVLTGATGYVGRALLDVLIADKRVGRVLCIGIRDLASRSDLVGLPKVQLFQGDLRHPRLGLSDKEAHSVFSKAHCIIHNAAAVSDMQAYQSLRLPNLQSTRELVEMSLPRRLPIHFVSTTEVGAYYTEATNRMVFPEISLAAYSPPTGGLDGYTASKWASERFLERLDEQTLGGWPIFIHRPSLISRPLHDPGRDVVHNIRHYSNRMRAVPIAPNIGGYMDMVPLEDVARGIADALHEPCASEAGVHFRHYHGAEALSLDDLKSWIMTSDDAKDVEELSMEEWARRAASFGMDPSVVAWAANMVTSRRLVLPKVTSESF
ncbi:putative Carrier domain-containing protein [Seiridium cardinale]|uniref:Carrier domain-containing protein n=1 Tax=Seiridium cardinale TaxID=138064 RepID=A0ABR2XND2_9PEZI